jgi:hypothetical protein
LVYNILDRFGESAKSQVGNAEKFFVLRGLQVEDAHGAERRLAGGVRAQIHEVGGAEASVAASVG